MRLIRLPFLSLLPWKYQSSEPRDEAQTESSVAAQAKGSNDYECRFCQSVTQIITLSINRSSDVLAYSSRDYGQLCSTFRRIARQRGWQNTYYSQDFNHLDKLYILISEPLSLRAEPTMLTTTLTSSHSLVKSIPCP